MQNGCSSPIQSWPSPHYSLTLNQLHLHPNSTGAKKRTATGPGRLDWDWDWDWDHQGLDNQLDLPLPSPRTPSLLLFPPKTSNPTQVSSIDKTSGSRVVFFLSLPLVPLAVSFFHSKLSVKSSSVVLSSSSSSVAFLTFPLVCPLAELPSASLSYHSSSSSFELRRAFK